MMRILEVDGICSLLMDVDVLVEVRVVMCHRDVDVGQLDLVVVPKMLYSFSLKTM